MEPPQNPGRFRVKGNVPRLDIHKISLRDLSTAMAGRGRQPIRSLLFSFRLLQVSRLCASGNIMTGSLGPLGGILQK